MDVVKWISNIRLVISFELVFVLVSCLLLLPSTWMVLAGRAHEVKDKWKYTLQVYCMFCLKLSIASRFGFTLIIWILFILMSLGLYLFKNYVCTVGFAVPIAATIVNYFIPQDETASSLFITSAVTVIVAVMMAKIKPIQRTCETIATIIIAISCLYIYYSVIFYHTLESKLPLFYIAPYNLNVDNYPRYLAVILAIYVIALIVDRVRDSTDEELKGFVSSANTIETTSIPKATKAEV